jgi:tetratricopeptide (TPR) repeat protein
MLGLRLAKNMKKARPAKSATRVARKAMSAGNGSGAKDAERRRSSGKNLTTTLNRLFAQERWAEARTVIEKELARDPDSHWLRARLSTTFYEERHYEQALEQIERAYRLAPDCPLVLWDYAGTLDAVGRTAEAIELYGRLLGKGVETVAYEECGEGVSWAIALLTDCCFRLGVCYEHLGQTAAADKHFVAYLILRVSNNADSIYSLEDALTHLRRLPLLSDESPAQRFEDIKQNLQRSMVFG